MSENVKGQNTNERNKEKHSHTQDDSRGGSENASANRGGTTDMDTQALTVDRGRDGRIASGTATKNNVTGSDFDGQVSPEK